MLSETGLFFFFSCKALCWVEVKNTDTDIRQPVFKSQPSHFLVMNQPWVCGDTYPESWDFLSMVTEQLGLRIVKAN